MQESVAGIAAIETRRQHRYRLRAAGADARCGGAERNAGEPGRRGGTWGVGARGHRSMQGAGTAHRVSWGFCATRVRVRAVRGIRVRIPSIQSRFSPPNGQRTNPRCADGPKANPRCADGPKTNPGCTDGQKANPSYVDARTANRGGTPKNGARTCNKPVTNDTLELRSAAAGHRSCT